MMQIGRIRFKRTLFGLFGYKLEVEDRRTAHSPGTFQRYWREASEHDAQIVFAEFQRLKELETSILRVKEKHPELFL